MMSPRQQVQIGFSGAGNRMSSLQPGFTECGQAVSMEALCFVSPSRSTEGRALTPWAPAWVCVFFQLLFILCYFGFHISNGFCTYCTYCILKTPQRGKCFQIMN